MIDPHPIRKRFASLSPHLSERERRLFAATEARAAGYGGIAAASAATGVAVSTIGRGLKELSALDTLAPDRVRRSGGGRKLLVEKDATLLDDLLAVARQPGWPVVLPHPKMLPRRRELSQPNAPWFHSPFAAAKPSRVTDNARSDVPVSAVPDPPVGVGSEVRWPFSLRP